MPLVKTLTTSAICNFCGDAITHTAGTHAPLALEYFYAHHWIVLEPAGTSHEWTVACPRCAPILDTVTGELDRRLKAVGV